MPWIPSRDPGMRKSGNRDSEKLRDIPDVTQQFGDRDGTRALVSLLQVQSFLPSSQT